MKYIVKLNNKEYEVEVEKGVASIVQKEVLSKPEVIREQVVEKVAPKTEAIKTNESIDGNAVVAPMPGVVRKILVNVGANVKKGTALLVFEAMKMENELVSPFTGVISAINVDVGTQISTGDKVVIVRN